MAEAATVVALVSTGVIKLDDTCSIEACRLTPAHECPSCRARWCSRHASEAGFECARCRRKLVATSAISLP